MERQTANLQAATTVPTRCRALLPTEIGCKMSPGHTLQLTGQTFFLQLGDAWQMTGIS